MSIRKALRTLTEAWAEDPDFRNAYQANIAMSFVDVVVRYRRETGKQYLNYQELHHLASVAADDFLRALEAK